MGIKPLTGGLPIRSMGIKTLTGGLPIRSMGIKHIDRQSSPIWLIRIKKNSTGDLPHCPANLPHNPMDIISDFCGLIYTW